MHKRFFHLLALLLPAISPAADTLRIVGANDYPPYSFHDSLGEPAGFSVELVRLIAQQLDRPISIRLHSWKHSIGEIKAGRADILLDMIPTEERGQHFAFTRSHAFLGYSWFTRSDQAILTSESHLVGLRLGVQTGDFMDGQLFLPNSQTPLWVRLESVRELLESLSQGRVDAVILDRHVGLSLLREMGLANLRDNASFGYLRGFGFAGRREDSLLVARLDLALHELRQDGTYDSLHTRWFDTLHSGRVGSDLIHRERIHLVSLATLLLTLVLAIAAWLGVRLRRRSRELLRSEARFSHMADHAQDVISRYRLHPDPGFEYVSPSVTGILGYTPEEHYQNPELGMRTIHPDDLDSFSQFIQKAETGSPATVLRFLAKDGSVVWMEMTSNPVKDASGNTIAFESIGRNINERMRSELRLRQQNEDLQGQRAELERLNGELLETNQRLQEGLASAQDRATQLVTLGDQLPGAALIQLLRRPDGTCQFLHLSEGLPLLLGVPGSRLRDDFLSFLSLLDGHSAIESLQRELARSSIEGSLLELDLPIQTSEGRLLYMHLMGKPTLQEDGSALFNAWIHDITQDKRARLDMARHFEILEMTNRQLQDTHSQLWSMHQKLESSEDRLRTLFDNSPLGLFRCNLEGRLDFVNRSLAQLLGGKNPDEVLGASQVSAVLWPHPDYAKELAAQLREGKDPGPLELEFIRLDGTQCWGRLNIRLDGEGTQASAVWMEGSLEDISEQKRTVEALEISESRYRNFLDVAPLPLLLHHRGAILRYNQLMESLLGTSQIDELHLDDFFVGGNQASLAFLLHTPSNSKGVFRGGGQLRRTDGSLRDVEAAAVNLQFEGKPASMLILQDVTQRNRLQREITNSLRLESLAALTAGISHEISQPLSAILLASDLLELSLQSGQPLDAQELLARYRGIAAEAERIRSVIEHMRELTRSEDLSGPVPADLSGLIDKALSLLTGRLQRHGIEWLQNSEENLPWVLTHPLQLEQVLVTLVTNLLEALDESGQDLKQITMDLGAAEPNSVTMILAGNGGWAGMDITHVFHPRESNDIPAHRLGLPLAKAFVESWNGTIKANALAQGGIAFEITLRAAPIDANAP